MKVTKLKIKNFRHIENQEIEFGKKLTVITGQNGTRVASDPIYLSAWNSVD